MPSNDSLPTFGDPKLAEMAWSEIRSLLEQQRFRIQEEIANYPPPITACDAQFNHLLEQRSRIARELVCMTKT